MLFCRAAFTSVLTLSIGMERRSKATSTPSSQFLVVSPTAATVAARGKFGSDWASESPPEVRAGVLGGVRNLHRGCFHVTNNVFHEIVVAVRTKVDAITSRYGPKLSKSCF